MPAPEPGESWGVLGGVFDPVHRGHLKLADDIRRGRKLDGVMLIPSFDPPHRHTAPVASYEDRVKMLELAAAHNSSLCISQIEAEMDRPSYTLKTLRALRKKYPQTEFGFIIGADNLSQLKTWYRWEEILRENRLLIGYRPGATVEAAGELPQATLDLVETEPLDISSTAIRKALRQGSDLEELCELVPRAIASYIVERGLYR